MDWLTGMNAVLWHIEDNLTEEIRHEELAKLVCCSAYEFSRLFSYMAGMTVSEYIRRRRLSQAVFDIQNSNDKIIDIALKYQYESPTTFTRAFKEMHGTTPLSARKSGVTLVNYPPMSFVLEIKGAKPLNFRIERRAAFNIVGMTGYMSVENNQGEPGSLWNAEIEFDGHSKDKATSADDFKIPEEITQEYGEFKPTTIDDIKTKIGVSISHGANKHTYYMTAAIDYMSEDGRVRAALGLVPDEMQEFRILTSKKSSPLLDTDTDNTNGEAMYYEVQAADWAVFSFEDERKTENVSRAYARILTEWFASSGYRRREDMPHLERFTLEDTEKNMKKWEIWMPVVASHLVKTPQIV